MLLLVAFLFSASYLMAENSILLNYKDGSIKTYALVQVSKLTFNSGNVVVNLKDGTNASSPIANLNKITIGDASGVNETLSDKSGVSILIGNDEISFAGISGSQQVNIYSLSGSLVASNTITESGNIPIENLSRGVYFLKIDSNITKFFKK